MNASQPGSVTPHEQQHDLSLEEMCRTCAVQSAFVVALLEEGVIEPVEGQTPDDWRFSTVQVRHVSVAWRLHRDLGVNLPGAALALQLLEEVETLRAQTLGPASSAMDARED